MINRFWDKLGICASGLCLVHCLVTPVILIAFPSINFTFIEQDFIHQTLAIFVVTSAMIAVYPQCHRHGHKDIILYAFLGLAFILGAVFFAHDLGDALEHIMTIIGSLFLLTAHLKNMKVRHGKCATTTNKVSTHDHAHHNHSHSHSHSHSHH